MNLHAIAGPIVAIVNPWVLAQYRQPTGTYTTAADGTRTPIYLPDVDLLVQRQALAGAQAGLDHGRAAQRFTQLVGNDAGGEVHRRGRPHQHGDGRLVVLRQQTPGPQRQGARGQRAEGRAAGAGHAGSLADVGKWNLLSICLLIKIKAGFA